ITLGSQTPIRQEREFYYDQLQRVVFDAASVLSLAYGSFRYATTPVVSPYVFVNRNARICFNYSTVSNVNVGHSIQGTIPGNQAIYFPVVDTVIRNLVNQSLTVNLTMDHNLESFLPSFRGTGIFYQVSSNQDDVKYHFRFYYDPSEIIDLSIDTFYRYDRDTNTWSPLKIVSSNTSLRYVEVELHGGSHILSFGKKILLLTYQFLPIISLVFGSVLLFAVVVLFYNFSRLNQLKRRYHL
ncbi:MAG: hypothetical protein ACW98F_06005, partial [Candidatus Hodarchaeales archaeon]